MTSNTLVGSRRTPRTKPGHRVDCDVHFTVIETEGVIAAEIEELMWLDPTSMDDHAVAPLTARIMRPYILTMSAAIQGRMPA